MDIQIALSQVCNAYDPERDLIPDAPRVTATDYTLARVCDDFAARISALETEVAGIHRLIDDLYRKNATNERKINSLTHKDN